MDQHINLNVQRNEVAPQQVYIIQLDPNESNCSQAIPLHILESDLDGDLILPLLQQKQGHILPQLLIEPHEESSEVANKYQIIQPQPYTPISSMIPVSPNNEDRKDSTSLYLNHIQNSALSKKYITISPCPPFVKKGVVPKKEDAATYFEVNVDIEKTQVHPPKRKLKNYVHISDTKAPPRAIAVLPGALQIKGKFVSPRRTLAPRIRFGPVQGIRRIITRLEAKMLHTNVTAPVFLLCQDENYVIHIDVSDKDKSNWIGLLPLGDRPTPTTASTANVWLYEESGELYALTMQAIGARTPLRLGYGVKYLEDHDIPQGPPVLDLETVCPIQWWCNECNRAMPTAAFLQRHTNLYHKDHIKSSWSSYRCKYCKRPFGRLFTLRRHMLTSCLKKPQKSPEKNQQSVQLKPESDISSALEDTRIPSDESFQNFTSSLDFSTSLFDTDRIAGLDISSHSRADSELNPYSIGFRDENGLSNDLGFTKLTNAPEDVQSHETDQDKKEPVLETCAYCNQVVVKENKGKHLRQCPSRLICECGRVFRHKKSLAQHIHKCHPSLKPTKTEQKKADEDKEMAYKCQECPVGFKRRGMLVNHLWRIHKMISTMPVEKKVRHYPCVVCPKIFCSSTKRNNHMRVHHPGSEKVHGQSIEGGVKSCQPASCTECPRQYATRAKLLQHVRAHHPHLAKAMKQQAIEKKAKLKTAMKKKATEKFNIATGNQPQFEFY